MDRWWRSLIDRLDAEIAACEADIRRCVEAQVEAEWAQVEATLVLQPPETGLAELLTKGAGQ